MFHGAVRRTKGDLNENVFVKLLTSDKQEGFFRFQKEITKNLNGKKNQNAQEGQKLTRVVLVFLPKCDQISQVLTLENGKSDYRGVSQAQCIGHPPPHIQVVYILGQARERPRQRGPAQ